MMVQSVELRGYAGVTARGALEPLAQCPAPYRSLGIDIDDMPARTEDFSEINVLSIGIGIQIAENVRGTATIIVIEIHGKITYRTREAIAPSSS